MTDDKQPDVPTRERLHALWHREEWRQLYEASLMLHTAVVRLRERTKAAERRVDELAQALREHISNDLVIQLLRDHDGTLSPAMRAAIDALEPNDAD